MHAMVLGGRLAADTIEAYCSTLTPISGRRAAAISVMIDDIAAASTAATDEGIPRTTFRRKQQRFGNASCYEEVCSLGEGAFGVVTKARHRATGRFVAVKSLRPRTREEEDDDVDEASYNLLREACFIAACRGHPSLVGLHSVLRAPHTDDYSLAMDYVGPTTLADVLADRRRDMPFPEAEVRRMMRQLLAGAEAMHRLGIVHRDIKPENVLVAGEDGGGALKICDFGLAVCVAEKEPPYLNAGTIPYMAPEALVQNPDHDTVVVDSWSLGCVMAELLLGGEVLFDGEDASDQLYKIFDVLGVPGKKVWQSLKPCSCLAADEVRQWRMRQRRTGRHRNRLRSLFLEEVLSKDGFEVLKGLLTCDPKRRLTAAAALRCRWFTDNVDVDGDPAAPAASEAAGATSTTVWSQVVEFVGRALGLLRPKAIAAHA